MTVRDHLECHRLLLLIEPTPTGSAPYVLALQMVAAGDHERRFGIQIAVLAGRELPLVISEPAVPGPRRGWELRTSGLWAELVCETPDEHWSYGLEAFALAVDDPEELLGRGMGQLTPLGWELEFEADEPPRATGPACQVQHGVGHGLLLGPDGARAVEGPALRGHGLIDPTAANGSTDPGAWLGDWLQRTDPAGPPGQPAPPGPPGPKNGSPGAGHQPRATDIVSADDVVLEVALPTANGIWWVARTATGVRTRGW